MDISNRNSKHCFSSSLISAFNIANSEMNQQTRTGQYNSLDFLKQINSVHFILQHNNDVQGNVHRNNELFIYEHNSKTKSLEWYIIMHHITVKT